MKFQLVVSSLIYVKYFVKRINFRNFTVSLHRVMPKASANACGCKKGHNIIWSSSEPASRLLYNLVQSHLIGREVTVSFETLLFKNENDV